MIIWTELTKDPVDNNVRNKVIDYLFSIRKNFYKNNYTTYLIENVKGKRVLDIGICEHVIERMQSEQWKHKIIVDNAEYSLGVDIISDLVENLKKDNYNVVECDATSDVYLGELFDVVNIGDVIEHVSSPVLLIEFALRHLKQDGKIIVRTPNAYHFNYVYVNKKIGTDRSNLEHLFYILPTHALEVARRAGCNLSAYYVQSKRGLKHAIWHLIKGNIRHAYAELFSKPEQYTAIYCYEFTKNSGA